MRKLIRGVIFPSVIFITLSTSFNILTPVWSAENPRDLASEIRRMSQNSQTVQQQDLQAWLRRAEPLLPQFNQISLAMTLHSLAKLKKAHHLKNPISDSFMQAWTSSALAKIDRFNSQGLSNSLYAFSMLGIHPTDPFLQAWQKKATESIESFNSQGLSNSLYAFSMLGIHPTDPFLQAWQKKAMESIGSFNSQELSNSLYAFSVLGIHPTDPFLQAWQKKAIDKIDDFNVKGLHQLFLARKLLFAQFKIMMPLQITLRLNKALETFKKQSPTVSNSQNRIAKDIRMLYSEDLQEEHWSEPTASYVDFAVPSSKLVIQFDGPHHFLFINGQASLSPQDQAMDFILRHEGWTVLRISYIDWNRIEDRPQNERIAELKRILGQAQH